MAGFSVWSSGSGARVVLDGGRAGPGGEAGPLRGRDVAAACELAGMTRRPGGWYRRDIAAGHGRRPAAGRVPVTSRVAGQGRGVRDLGPQR